MTTLCKKTVQIQILPVGQGPPKRSAEKLNEWPETDEKTTLSSIHTHLLKIYSHKRKQRTKGRVEEEIESLYGEEFLIDGTEEILQDIALTAYFMRGFLRLRIYGGIDLTLGLRIYYRSNARNLRESPRWLHIGRIIRRSIVVIFVSIVLHDSSYLLSRSETLSR